MMTEDEIDAYGPQRARAYREAQARAQAIRRQGRFVKGLAIAALGGIAAALLMAVVGAGDVREAQGIGFVPSSSVRVWLDPETGCEYFYPDFRPRMGTDGRQMCSTEGVTAP